MSKVRAIQEIDRFAQFVDTFEGDKPIRRTKQFLPERIQVMIDEHKRGKVKVYIIDTYDTIMEMSPACIRLLHESVQEILATPPPRKKAPTRKRK